MLPKRYKYLRNKKTARRYVFAHYSYYQNGVLCLTERGKEILVELDILDTCLFPTKNILNYGRRR